MRLHENPIQDTRLGVQQIHAQLQNLCMEMQSLKQDRTPWPEAREEVWCIKFKGKGHDKDHCPVFANYLVGGGLMSLRPQAQARPSAASALWCAICQIGGKHTTDNCHMLQKYTQTSQQLFCNFCRTVGHDERTCRSYELMMDRTHTYRVQTETQAPRPKCRDGMCWILGAQSRWNGTKKGLQTTNLLQLQRARALCPRLYKPEKDIILVLYTV